VPETPAARQPPAVSYDVVPIIVQARGYGDDIDGLARNEFSFTEARSRCPRAPATRKTAFLPRCGQRNIRAPVAYFLNFSRSLVVICCALRIRNLWSASRS
jgi:hypothetical protein